MKPNEALKNYPMQFRDKIDEYLWKEHHILGGCCSSIESMKYNVAREVAEKLTDTFINKVCEWLKNFNDFHNIMRYSDCCEVSLDQLIEDFRNYIKGE